MFCVSSSDADMVTMPSDSPVFAMTWWGAIETPPAISKHVPANLSAHRLLRNPSTFSPPAYACHNARRQHSVFGLVLRYNAIRGGVLLSLFLAAKPRSLSFGPAGLVCMAAII